MNRLLALALTFVSVTGLSQWTCGDTWTYQGYNYETVQIGDQCWFAENLRSDQYANGDVIPSNVPDSALWTTQGAQTFFNLDSTSLDERGRLYNALAVVDERGLCPTEWHVPTDDEFMDLELFIGMNEDEVTMTGENRGCEEGVAALIKSDTDWGGEGAGTNETGLGLKWTGYHFYPDGPDGFGNYGQGHYWTSSLRYPATSNSPAYYWSRNLIGWNNCIWRGHDHLAVGRAARCMRTVESDSNEDSGGTDSDIQGCTDPDALNFNPEATADDGSCVASDWSCGEPWTYQGHAYETVQMGNQCWFAENLRNTTLADGTSLSQPGAAGWIDNQENGGTTPACIAYGTGEFPCDSDVPDFDGCDEALALENFGLLYNWFAVMAPGGLCPTAWEVSTEENWDALELWLDDQGLDASDLASTELWAVSWGSNATGFSGLPGGDLETTFAAIGSNGYWWSPGPVQTHFLHHLEQGSPEVKDAGANPNDGRSVRCVLSTELETDNDIQGCTDPDALNFNPEATADDGSCVASDWSCGEPWTHQGHAYETVLIGDQCWFAENLRSEQYANGDDLLHAGPDSLWADANQTSSGAWCHPNGEPENSVAYGHLYNHWVAVDERGVCPTGWNVPTDGDYIQLEMHAGMPLEVALEEDVRGTDEGLKLKAAEGQFEGWQGTDAYGFSWVPGGWRHVGGSYGGTHALGLQLFTPSEESNGAPYGFRQVDGTQTQVGRYFIGNMGDGRSIRCLLASSCSADNDIQGCTDPDALNFNPEATADDESCTYAPEVPECASVCGPGTYWNMEQSLCLPTLSADLDLSGCVGMSDLLELLSQFGACFVPEWSCGDDLNYQGYDYQTVMVAGDCWFAENLKSENYRNGDPIPTLEGEEAWFYTEEGAQGVYANGQVPCHSFCNSNDTYDLFGRVYNWFAVDDNRGLCPSGWHVSDQDDWENLFSYVEDQVGDSVSFALKATSTWYEVDGIPGVGTDDFGMSIMPTGQRAVKLHGNGSLALDANAGTQGSYWTSNAHSTERGRGVYFHHLIPDPNISIPEKEYAISVRCVLD